MSVAPAVMLIAKASIQMPWLAAVCLASWLQNPEEDDVASTDLTSFSS